ncbi:hypothetical protein [uncultured Sphingopyxis sp.]|uniref:hypothetical protein n=1 Tax=uncultured Sphingopyxis sp. TaxID=310581 RepID=UPI002600BCF3|nr:hypothetical protein [uncultured Sphingopyxis sp.]
MKTLSGGVAAVWLRTPLIRHGAVPPEVEGIFESPSWNAIVRGTGVLPPQRKERLPLHVPAGNAIFTVTAGTLATGNADTSRGALGRPVKVIPGQMRPPESVTDCSLGTLDETSTLASTLQLVHIPRLFWTSRVPVKLCKPSGVALAWAMPGVASASAVALITENFFISTLLLAV